jgi:hypothetical protein
MGTEFGRALRKFTFFGILLRFGLPGAAIYGAIDYLWFVIVRPQDGYSLTRAAIHDLLFGLLLSIGFNSMARQADRDAERSD